MARNGSGAYALPINSWNPAVNAVSATPADWRALINDVATTLQASVASDGQTPMSGNLQMGGYRLIGAGAPTGTGMSLRWEQLIQGADIPSATTVTIPLEGQYFAITGSTAITALAATIAGRLVYLKFAAGIVLTHSAGLIMPSGVSVTTQTDDVAVFMAEAAGVWRCVAYPRFSGANYPSATAPTITWPFMTWADTGNMLLKRRNAANTAWVDIGPLLVEMAVKTGDSTQNFKAAPSVADDDVVVRGEVFGVGQTRQDVSSSRTLGTLYTNTTPKPIVVSITAVISGGSNAAGLIFKINSNTTLQAIYYVTSGTQVAIPIEATVMPNETYSGTLQFGSLVSLTWREIR